MQMANQNDLAGNGLGVTRIGDSVFTWGKRTYIMGIVNGVNILTY